jgi:translation initiation factor IF-2
MRSAGNFSPEWGYLAPAPSFMRTARVVLVATAVGATAGAGVVLSLVDHPATEANQSSIAARAIVTSVQAATPPATMPVASVAPAAVVAPVNVPPAAQAQIPAQTPAQVPLHTAIQVPASPNVPQVPVVHTVVATPAVATPSPAPQPAQPVAVQATATDGHVAGSGSGEANSISASPSAPGIASLSASAPAPEVSPTDSLIAPESALPPKKIVKSKTTGPNAPNGVNSANSKNKPDPGLGSVLRRLFSARAGNSYYSN